MNDIHIPLIQWMGGLLITVIGAAFSVVLKHIADTLTELQKEIKDDRNAIENRIKVLEIQITTLETQHSMIHHSFKNT